MKRHTPRWLTAALLTVGFSLAAVAMTGDRPPPDAHCVEVEELGVFVCGTTTTSSTTSTTTPSSTSTSSTVPDTQPTTTTTLGTTTTTVTGALVIPETIPYPPGLNEGEGFRFMVGCADDIDKRTGEVLLDCVETSAGKLQYAEFDYVGHGMPYLYSEAVEGNHDHAWWVNGDREGYRCAYGFMYDKHPNPFGHDIQREGTFIARATIVRPDGNGYGKVNDTYMEEGERYYDGTVANEGGKEISEDCQQAALDDFDYDSYVPHGPDQIRVGLFRGDGEIGDVRDFTTVDVADNLGHFEFVSLVDGRVTIVFVLHQNQKVSHVFYYDELNSGRIAVEVNGQTEGE